MSDMSGDVNSRETHTAMLMPTKSEKTERRMLWQSITLRTVKSLRPQSCMQAVQTLSSISGARKEIYSRGLIMESWNVSYRRWNLTGGGSTVYMLQASKVLSIVSVCILYCVRVSPSF